MNNRSSAEYLAAISKLTGSDGRIYEMTDPGDALPVSVAVYDNIPEVGHLTAFSFGLSSAVHSEWIGGKPELMISVKSMDHAWALCMGEIVRTGRDSALFEYGSIIHFRERILDECPITSFLVFASSLLGSEHRSFRLSDRRINIAQLYPIYESEAKLIKDIGVERFFWELGIDFSNVDREPLELD